MCLILHLEAVLFAHRWLQCVRLAQARLITGGFAWTSSTFDSLMVSVGAFWFCCCFLKRNNILRCLLQRKKRLFIWNTEAGFSQACLTVCVQACCSVKSIFELLPVDEKCLLSHIADVIFSHYWWRLSLMRWAGEKTGNGIEKWPETNQT